jgi:plastocyanin
MPVVRRSPPAIALIGVIASLLALAAPPPTRAAEHDVQIVDSTFSPASLTIQVGDTVTWRNADDRPHTVTANDGAFDSGNLDEGRGFSFTFTESGTYTYRCDYHPEMQATIVVEAASALAGTPTQATGRSGGSGGQAPEDAGRAAAPDDGATAAATHAAGGHAAGQPDTALEAPVSMAWLAPMLIGLGLVAFAFGVVPPRGTASRARAEAVRSRGWRR